MRATRESLLPSTWGQTRIAIHDLFLRFCAFKSKAGSSSAYTEGHGMNTAFSVADCALSVLMHIVTAQCHSKERTTLDLTARRISSFVLFGQKMLEIVLQIAGRFSWLVDGYRWRSPSSAVDVWHSAMTDSGPALSTCALCVLPSPSLSDSTEQWYRARHLGSVRMVVKEGQPGIPQPT